METRTQFKSVIFTMDIFAVCFGHKISWSSQVQGSKVFLFTILTGFPEIQPRPSWDYDRKSQNRFFKTFSQQNSVILFQVWMTIVLSFFWGALRFCSFKNEDFSILGPNFLFLDHGHFGDLHNFNLSNLNRVSNFS